MLAAFLYTIKAAAADEQAGSAIDQARMLYPPAPSAQENGEFEGAAFWEENESLRSRATDVECSLAAVQERERVGRAAEDEAAGERGKAGPMAAAADGQYACALRAHQSRRAVASTRSARILI